MNHFLKLILVVTLVSSGVKASWWRRNKGWAKPIAIGAGIAFIGRRDVGGEEITELAKSLGFKPDSEEFLDLFEIADKDGNGKLDAMEVKHLKQLAQGMKKLEKVSKRYSLR